MSSQGQPVDPLLSFDPIFDRKRRPKRLTQEQIDLIASRLAGASVAKAEHPGIFDTSGPLGVFQLPLNLLDATRRVIASGVKEAIDAIDPQQGDGKDASWSDFLDQVNHGIGYGDIIHDYGGTGNIWADRALGFIGDVALDPMTYLTAGGSVAAKAGGKAPLAAKLLEDAAVAERALSHVDEVAKVAGTALSEVDRAAQAASTVERIAGKVGKSGLADLTAEEARIAGLPGGLRWKLPGMKDGFEVIGQDTWSKVASPLAAASEKVRVGPVGKYFAKHFGGDPINRYVTDMLRKGDPIITKRVIGEEMVIRNVARQAGADMSSIFQPRIIELLRAAGKDKAVHRAVLDILQAGADTAYIETSLAAEKALLESRGLGKLVDQAREFYATGHKYITDAGIEMNNRGSSYANWMFTPEAQREAASRAGSSPAKAAFEHQRGIYEEYKGQKIPIISEGLANGTITKAEDGTLLLPDGFNYTRYRRELESAARAVDSTFTDPLETNLERLLSGYARAAVERVKNTRIQKGLIERGLAVGAADHQLSTQLEKLAKLAAGVDKKLQKRIALIAQRTAKLAELEAKFDTTAADAPAKLAAMEAMRSQAQRDVQETIALLRQAGGKKNLELADKMEAALGEYMATEKIRVQRLQGVSNAAARAAEGGVATGDPKNEAVIPGLLRDTVPRAQASGVQDIGAAADAARATREELKTGIGEIDNQIAEIATTKDEAVGKILERHQKLQSQAARLDTSIARLQKRIASATPDELPQLQAKLEDMVAKRAGIDAEIGGRQGGTRVSKIDKALKNERQNAARKIARREALKAELGGELADAQEVVRNVDQLRRSAIPRAQTIEAKAAKATGQTKELLDSAAAKMNEAAQMIETADQMAANVAFEAAPPAVQALYALAGTKAAEAQLESMPGLAARIAKDIELRGVDEAKLNKYLDQFARGTNAKQFEENLMRMTGEALAQWGDTMLPEQLAQALVDMNAFYDLTGFMGWVRKFNTAWKGMATLSPGFHVRNYYSGSWSNFAAGVPIRFQMRFAHEYERWIFNRTARDTEMRKLIEMLATEGFFNQGQVANELGTKLSFLTRQSQKGGNHVENVLRGALAAHVYQTAGETVSREGRLYMMEKAVAKWHFDYNDLTKTERYLKQVIPFYTWARKNMVLQAELMATQPGKINLYFDLKRNMELGQEDNPFMPGYLKEQLAIQLPFKINGMPLVFNPDLPFRSAIETASKLNDPARLLSQATPLIKVPFEIAAKRDLYTGKDLQDSKVQLPWFITPLVPAMKVAGWVSTDPATGQLMIAEDKMRALESFLPVLGRARRLAPSEDKYQQRILTSWANFIGLPIKGITDVEMLYEYRHQEYAKRQAKDPTAEAERKKRKQEVDLARMRAILGGAA